MTEIDPKNCRLRELREKDNLSRPQLAKLADISEYTIDSCERKGSQLNVYDAYRLAHALGCTIEYLIGVPDLCVMISGQTAAENRHLRNQMVKIRAELQGTCELIRRDLIKEEL